MWVPCTLDPALSSPDPTSGYPDLVLDMIFHSYVNTTWARKYIRERIYMVDSMFNSPFPEKLSGWKSYPLFAGKSSEVGY